MISLEIDSQPDINWNNRLLDTKTGIIHQTKEYGIYVKQEHKWNPIFLKFLDSKGDIIGQLLINYYSRFQNSFIESFFDKLSIRKQALRWQFGPIIFDENYTEEVITKLREFLLSKKCKVLGSEHPLAGGILSFLGAPFKIQNWGTFVINLKLDRQILWDNLDKHSARKNIERSKKRDIFIREMSSSDLPDYHKMLKPTKLKTNLDLHLSSIENIWNYLTPIGLTGFMAFKDEEPVGAILVSSFNNNINELGVARTEKDTNEKLYSQDYLKWKIIKWGIQHKYNFYDLSGANPHSTNEKEKGIFRYKQKWGGKFIKYQKCSL